MALISRLQTNKVCSIFCGGILSPNKIDHPECVLVDPKDGAIWCGGEAGQLYRINPDGSSAKQMGTSGGFALGLCMDAKRHIYMCDLEAACVVVFDEHGNELKRLHGIDKEERLQIPNYAVLSPDENFLYVSDTRRAGGPGIWRFDLNSETSELWMKEICYSANGMALTPDGTSLCLVESHLPRVSIISIQPDGSAGKKKALINLPDDEPDGLAFAPDGSLWISIYNPSRIYRYDFASQQLELILQDDTTDYLNRATNIAFRGENELFSANLGAWHITRIDLSDL